MKIRILAAWALIAAAAAAKAGAQAPCLTLKAVVDSARDDALSVLTSDRPLVAELRREQHIASADALTPVRVVNERYVCARMAALFDHSIAPGIRFAVLKIGPLYYARDPDQQRGTGIIADSTFRVLMRLGAAVPEAN